MNEQQTEQRKDVYEQLSAYGLLPVLFDKVGRIRATGAVSRKSVWNAFNVEDGELTPLHNLIVGTGRKVLSDHKVKLKSEGLLPV